MSSKLTIPAELVRTLRIGLHSALGDAASEIVEVTTQPDREKYSEWYDEPLIQLDAARDLLDVIGWDEPGRRREIAIEVDLAEHGVALLTALRGQVLIHEDMLDEAEDVDAERAERGQAPKGARTAARAAALNQLFTVAEARAAALRQAMPEQSDGRRGVMAGRRSYGSGRVYVRTDAAGRETFYGSWWASRRRIKRRLGVKRARGSREGLTASQAETELRRLMSEVTPSSSPSDRLALAEVGRRYRKHLEALGRKRSTLVAVEMTLRVWIEPHLGDRALDKIRPEDIEDLMRTMSRAGLGVKSVRNYIGTLSAIFRFAMHPRRKWASSNPCEVIDLPPVRTSEEIRFLTVAEVDALATAAVSGEHQALDRALYVVAAMTGLRQGELIALRWQDVDRDARRIRVRRSHVLGEFDTPKSRRSERSVP